MCGERMKVRIEGRGMGEERGEINRNIENGRVGRLGSDEKYGRMI